MTEIKSRRLPCGQHKLYKDGRVVGRAWKWGAATGFGLRIDGVYWRGGMPNTESGITTTTCRTLTECKRLTAATLAGVKHEA